MRNSRGMATMMALGVAGFVGVCALIWSVTREQQVKVVKYMEQKSAAETLRRQLANLFLDASLCACQIGGPTRTFNPTVTDGSQKVALSEIRNACAPAAPIVLAVNQKFPGGMTVAKIELANLKPSAPASLSWTADLRVTWDSGRGTPIVPTEVPQQVTINAGNPAHVVGCQPPSAGGTVIQTCPVNWDMVGPPGAISTYCIQSQPNAMTATYTNATDICANPTPTSMGLAHICNHSEWYAACTGIPTFKSTVVGWEWNVEYAGNDVEVVASGGDAGNDCNASRKQNIGTTSHFRCCFP